MRVEKEELEEGEQGREGREKGGHGDKLSLRSFVSPSSADFVKQSETALTETLSDLSMDPLQSQPHPQTFPPSSRLPGFPPSLTTETRRAKEHELRRLRRKLVDLAGLGRPRYRQGWEGKGCLDDLASSLSSLEG